jgi:hypothetical protein
MKTKEKTSEANRKDPITSLQVFLLILGVFLLAVLLNRYISQNQTTQSALDDQLPSSYSSKPTAPAVYIKPASGTHAAGSTFKVEIRENSGSSPVNAVQANFSYPESLSYVSADASGSPFTIPAQTNGGAGTVTLARGVIGSLSGDHLVARVTFKAGLTGTAKLSFSTGTALVSASDNQNLITTSSGLRGSTITIR